LPIDLDRVEYVDAMSTAALLEVHMQDPTGREFGVDVHFVGDGIEQLVGYPDWKDILNQNRHDRTPLS
jgi:hypothetical protein